jgi:cytochrome b6-f complex iron-sulfur subunit
MSINRRDFLWLTAALTAGCKNVPVPETASPGTPVAPAAPAASGATRNVDAGPASQYAADGLYDAFRHQGFFLVRRGSELTALSSYCTHRRCKLRPEEGNQSLLCPCHGSTFTLEGKVTEGPAKRDLPVLHTEKSPDGRLLVGVPIG